MEKRLKILFIAYGANPRHVGLSYRMYLFAKMAASLGELHFLSPDSEGAPGVGETFHHYPSYHRKNLFSRLKRVVTYYRTDFARPILPFKPDLIQVEDLDLYGLARFFPGVPVILDEHNVWWELRRHTLTAGPTLKSLPLTSLLKPWLLSRAKAYEKRGLRRADRILVCSEADQKRIVAEEPQVSSKVTVIPNSLELDHYHPLSGWGEGVFFVGAFSYPPNVEAFQLICKEVAPRLPQIPFYIIGKNGPDLKPPPNVTLLGFVEDLPAVLSKARLCITPLRHGSGTRVKILEYMALARPVLSTAKGAEGLEVTDGEDILLEESMDRFADKIGQLYQDQKGCRRLGEAGRRLVEKKHSYLKSREQLASVYEELTR